jgi:hypothetical protein
MGFSPLENELQNNYAVVARPQPLLAPVRRYFGDCGGNATKWAPQDYGGEKNPAARPGFVVLQEKRQIQYFATIGGGAHMSNL